MQDTTNRQGRIEVLSFAVTSDAAAGSEDFNTIAAADADTPPPPAAVGPDPNPVTSPNRPAAGGQQQQHQGSAAAGNVVYQRGVISDLPEDLGSRKERFLELDQ